MKFKPERKRSEFLKRFLALLLAVAMAVSLMPGMELVVQAASPKVLHATAGASDGVVYALTKKTSGFIVGQQYTFIKGSANADYITRLPNNTGILKVVSNDRETRGWSPYITNPEIDAYVDVIRATYGFDTCKHGTLNGGASEYSCNASGVQHLAGAAYSYVSYPYGSRIQIHLTKDGKPWNDARVSINRHGQELSSGVNGTYDFGYYPNGTYSVIVEDGEVEKLTVNARPTDEDAGVPGGTVTGYGGRTFQYVTDMVFSKSYDYKTLKAKAVLNPDKNGGTVTAEAGSVLLAINGHTLFRGNQGTVEHVFHGANDSVFQILIDGKDTGFTVGKGTGRDSNPLSIEGVTECTTVNFYRMKVTLETDDNSLHDADVTLRDAKGEYLQGLTYDAAASDTNKAAYSAIMQEDTGANPTDYYIYVNGSYVYQKLQRVAGRYEASVPYYTATVNLKKDGAAWASAPVSVDNGRNQYTLTSQGDGSYKVRVLSGEPYRVSVMGVVDSTAPSELTSQHKTVEHGYYTVAFHNYKASGHEYVTDDSTGRSQVVRKGCPANPVAVYVEGLSFRWFSSEQWNAASGSKAALEPKTAYDYSTGVQVKTDLYAQFGIPKLEVQDFVRTDASGNENGSGMYFRLGNLTVSGFKNTTDAVKGARIEMENTTSVKVLSGENNTVVSDAEGTVISAGNSSTTGTLYIQFNKDGSDTKGITQGQAQDWLRKNLVFTPKSGQVDTDKCVIEVTVSDGVISKDDVTTNSQSLATFTPANLQTVSELTGGTNTQLNTGTYYVGSDVSYTDSNGTGALRIAENATVYIYVKAGCTLTCTGKNASGTTGGGAGIYVPASATLVLSGDGTVVATGGNAANGTNGGNGGDITGTIKEYEYGIKYSEDGTGGSGGKGGDGGGGAGAGIGGNGGNGGQGGAGGQGSNNQAFQNDASCKGKDGTAGGNSNCGRIYLQGGLNISGIKGGNAGTNGIDGAGHESSSVHVNAYNSYVYYVPGCGAGYGQGGGAAQTVGAGGYGGFGGGGGDGCGTSQNRPGTVGGLNGNGAGFSWIDQSNGDGGKHGASGTSNTPTDYVHKKDGTNKTYSVTFIGAGSNATQNYIFGAEANIVVPDYTPSDSSFYFLGWQVTMYGKTAGDPVGDAPLTSAEATYYIPGKTISLAKNTIGNIILTPITRKMTGVQKTDSESMLFKSNMDPTTYYTHTVQTTLDGAGTDMGPITLTKSGGGETFELTAGDGGIYSMTRANEGGSYTVHSEKYGDLGTVDSGNTLSVPFESVTVTVKGKETDNVLLKSGTSAGPVLTKESSTGSGDAAEAQWQHIRKVGESASGPYDIYVDGEGTGKTVSFNGGNAPGGAATVQFHTLTVHLNGSAAKRVVLKEKTSGSSGSGGTESDTITMDRSGTEATSQTFTYTGLKSTTEYDVFVDGVQSPVTSAGKVDFNSTHQVEVRYLVQTAKITVKVDGTASDAVGVEPQYGSQYMTKKTGEGSTGVYEYTSVNGTAQEVKMAGVKAVDSLAPDGNADINYYTLTYAKAGDEAGDLPAENGEKYLSGTTVDLSECSLTNGRKVFKGWKLRKGDTDLDGVLAPGTKVTVDGKLTATAVWEGQSFSENTPDGRSLSLRIEGDPVSYKYNAKSQIPSISVLLGNDELGYELLTEDTSAGHDTAGTDYYLTYQNTNTTGGNDGEGDTTNAGTITITVHGKGDFAGTLTGAYEIKPIPVTIADVRAVNRAYDGTTAVDLDFTDMVINGIRSADYSNVSVTGLSSDQGNGRGTIESADAGEDKPVTLNTTGVSLTGTAASNYTLTGIEAVTVDILRANIYPAVSMENYAYGGTPSTPILGVDTGAPTDAAANPGNAKVTYYYNTADNNINGTEWKDITGTTLAAGVYYMYAVVEASNNYYGKTTQPKEFTVTQASSANLTATGSAKVGQSGTVELPANLFIQGGTVGSPSITENTDDVLDGTPTLAKTGENSEFSTEGGVLSFGFKSNAVPGKKATVTIPVTGMTNFQDYNIIVTLTVEAKDPQVLAFADDAVTKTYGDAAFIATAAHTVGDGAVTYTVTYEKDANGNAVTNAGDTVTINGTTGEVTIRNAGSATIKAAAAETAAYLSAEASYALTINRAAVTIKADDKSMTSGDQTEPVLTATVTGLVGADTAGTETGNTIVYTLGRADGTNVGDYTITPGGNATQGNYTVTYETGTFSITSGPVYNLSVTAPAFEAETEGYTRPDAKALTITSVGNASSRITSVALSGTDADKFMLSRSGGAEGENSTLTLEMSMAANTKDEATFLIRPAEGLAADFDATSAEKPYTATVSVTYDSGEGSESKTAQTEVSFLVRRLGVTVPTFTDAVYDDPQPAPGSISLINNGHGSIRVSSVELTGEKAGSFELVKADGTAGGFVSAGSSIVKEHNISGGSTDNTAFFVRPKAQLSHGTYTAAVEVTYGNGSTEYTVGEDISFIVKPNRYAKPKTAGEAAAAVKNGSSLVTVNPADIGKKDAAGNDKVLQYALIETNDVSNYFIPSSENDSNGENKPSLSFTDVPALSEGGTFQPDGLTGGGTGYTIYFRFKESTDGNYLESFTNSASWTTPLNITVNYDANGGSGKAPQSQEGDGVTPVTVADAGGLSRTGYTFTEWNKVSDASEQTPGTAYAPGSKINENANLYAQWKANTYTLKLDARGGSVSPTTRKLTYDEEYTLPTPARRGYKFVGWTADVDGTRSGYADKAVVKNLAEEDGAVFILYALWADQDYSVTVETFSDYSDQIKLELKQGRNTIAEETISLTYQGSGAETGKKYKGEKVFRNVAEGVYNIIATQKTGEGKTLTMTIAVAVNTDEASVNGNVPAPEIVMPKGDTNSVLDVKADTPAVIVGNLEKEAESQHPDVSDGQSVTVTMTIEEKTEKALKSGTDEESKSVAAISTEAAKTDSDQKLEFINIDVLRTVKDTTTGSENREEITETDNVIEIVIPIWNRAWNKVGGMYRYHNNKSETLEYSVSKSEGTYYINGFYIFLYARLFSTYAIGYEQESSGGGNGGGGGTGGGTGGGGGGGNTPTPPPTPGDNKPVILQPEHGSVNTDPEDPKPGDDVTITVTSEDGFKPGTVTVTDANGNPVEVTQNADGTYTFKQPANGKVSIVAVIVPDVPEDKVTVAFNLMGKPGTAPEPQIIDKGAKATRPAEDPTADGFKFINWYADEACTTVYDFDTVVNESIILYAGWEAVVPPAPDEDFGIYFAELFDDPYDGVYYNAEKDRYEIIYTGEAIRPLMVVTSKADGILKEGVDYTVSYSNNKKVSTKKPASIIVRGKGQYKDKKKLELHILPADLETAYDKGLLVLEDEIRVESGKKLNPVITYRGIKLKSSDRSFSNKSKITADTTVNITGKGNFTGELKDVPVKVITKENIKNGTIKVSLKAAAHTYNGYAQELTITTAENAGELTVTAGSNKTPLTVDTDFTVSYSANINAGTAKVTVTGIGDKYGTVVKTFKIAPDKAAKITADLTDPDEAVYYSPRGAMPDVTVMTAVTEEGKETGEVRELIKGRDYKITYSANKKVGNGAYKVTFLGNYKGHQAVTGSYKITEASLEGAKVEAAQMLYKKPGRYLSKPFVSVDGVQLKTSDYTFKYYEGEVTDVTADGVKELTARDRLALADSETEKTITIAVTAKNNYTGTALGYYKVVKPAAEKIDLSKAKIVAKDKNAKGKDVKVGKQEYTGYVIEPEIRVLVKQNKTWIEVDPSKYEISYINNVMKGKATILITGNGTDAVGCRTANFSITNMRMNLFKLIFGR